MRAGADPELGDAAEEMPDRVLRIRLTDQIVRAARQFPQRHLRSLDAIQLACAEHLEQALTAFVTYDKRLVAAAAERDLPVQSPGI